MIFGTDTSSYQPIGTYDPGAFEIINAEDRMLPDKVAINRDAGRPWGVYPWVYPGEHGQVTVNRALAALAKVGGGPAPLGIWFDYEQDDADGTVEPWQLDECFAACDATGMWSGYYSNTWRLDHRPYLARPFWCAGYPWPNDGSFPGWDKLPAGRDINIWQFTSTNGTLDQNVIVDEAWYASLGASPKLTIKECDMYVGWGTDAAGTMFTEKLDGGISTLPFGGVVSAYGFYQDGYDYATKYGVPFVLLSADEIAFARLRNYQVQHPPTGGDGAPANLVVESQVTSTVHSA